MKFATDENVLKTYNYASVGKTSETLTVTNKRVIFSAEGKMSDGSLVHSTEEVKISSIEKVSGRVASKRSGKLLFFMFFFIAVAVAAYFIISAKLPDLDKTISLIPLIAGGVFALIFLIAFICSKKVSFVLELFTNQCAGMGISTDIGNLKQGKKKKKIKVKVNQKIAIEVIEEIGSLIVEKYE
jgi:hypothetical protein